MLCLTSFCERSCLPKAPEVFFWVEQHNPWWQPANIVFLEHSGERKHAVPLQKQLKISVYREQDYWVERQLGEKHL